jgi:REP element-mobilizing transposase RayT
VEYLDRGVGECWLRNQRVAKVVEDALLHRHEQQYELLAWCVMPNHVHVLVHVWTTPLAKMLQCWKSFSGGKANEILARDGTFWEPEYWDTYMRTQGQERIAVHYIENNPLKAKLCGAPEEWKFSSGRFRDEYRQLNLTARVGAAQAGAQGSSSAR